MIVIDQSTSKSYYINSKGNTVFQEQFDKQARHYATLDSILEITTKEIIAKEIIDNQLNDDYEQLIVKTLYNSNIKRTDDNNRDKDDDSKSKEVEEVEPCSKKHKMTTLTDLTPLEYLTIGSKSVIILKCRPTLPTGHRSKYQSKIKSQKKIIIAKERGECLDDVDQLVQDTKSIISKNIKSKYLAIVKKLKVIEYDSKVAELVDAKKEIERLQKQLDKAKANVKKA